MSWCNLTLGSGGRRNVGPKFMEANRRALQSREKLLPYIYTAHRALFDAVRGPGLQLGHQLLLPSAHMFASRTMQGVGIMQPLYYHYPKAEQAYRECAPAVSFHCLSPRFHGVRRLLV